MLAPLQRPSKGEAHLWAYGDESGTQEGAKYCLLLGSVSSDNQWEFFNRLWSDVLERHNNVTTLTSSILLIFPSGAVRRALQIPTVVGLTGANSNS